MALSIGYGCFVLFLLFFSDFFGQVFVLSEVVPHSLFRKSFILASYKSRENFPALPRTSSHLGCCDSSFPLCFFN
jgi:hypothetical protein